MKYIIPFITCFLMLVACTKESDYSAPEGTIYTPRKNAFRATKISGTSTHWGNFTLYLEYDKEELNSIRFTTPNEEHDILYTMSSGQLSGILLAFSLALHKIFINAGLNIMLIDDPVQCMDDLNIVSFVELIRTEFPNVQFLISTHENSFAGYIGYKYKKYNLPVQRCNLKEISTL